MCIRDSPGRVAGFSGRSRHPPDGGLIDQAWTRGLIFKVRSPGGACHPNNERGGMTIVETRAVTGGVDTHLNVHVAAALDDVGGLLGVESFPTTSAGYKALLD